MNILGCQNDLVVKKTRPLTGVYCASHFFVFLTKLIYFFTTSSLIKTAAKKLRKYKNFKKCKKIS